MVPTRNAYITEGLGFYCVPLMYEKHLRFSLPAVGLYSSSPLRGTQGDRVYTTARVWAPAGLRAASSGRSKSRELPLFHGIGFRRARTKQDDGNPHDLNDPGRFSCVVLCVNSSHHAWSSDHFEPRPSSRSTAVTLRVYFFVPRCFVCACVRGSQMEVSRKQRCNWFGFGNSAIDPFYSSEASF